MISVFGRDLQVRNPTFGNGGLVETLLRSTCPTNLFWGGMALMAEDSDERPRASFSRYYVYEYMVVEQAYNRRHGLCKHRMGHGLAG